MMASEVKVGVRQIAEAPDALFPRKGNFTECHKKFRELNGRTAVGPYVNICFEYIRTHHPELYDSADPRYAACGKFGRQTRRVEAAKTDLLSLIEDLFPVKS